MSQTDPRAQQIFEKVSIPVAYKLGYITNTYREPLFRAIELALGLSRPETLVLIVLAEVDGCTASEICEHSGHLKANISRAVSLLEAKGLVQRRASSEDLRRQHLHLTQNGRDLHDRFIPQLRAREQAMLACLSKAEYAMFAELLGKICAHVPNWQDKGL